MRTRGNSGFSLVEVLIALAILTIFSLGILEMYKSSLSFKTQGVTKLQVDQIRSKLVACIQNNDAWARTINYPGNAVLNCLRVGQAPCTTTTPAGPIQILDSTGPGPCILGTGSGPAGYDSTNANLGFTKDGFLCDFTASPDCLFRPKVIWRPIPCAFGVCPNPTSAVDISFEFFPGRNDKNFAVNLTSYNQTVVRGNDFTKNEYILINEEKPKGTNAGTCGGTLWKQRIMNAKKYDYFSNVTVNPTGLMRFKAGTYSCTFYAPGLRVNRHQARLQNKTSNMTLIWGSNQFSIKSLAGSLTQSTGKGLFTLTVDSDLAIEHNCPAGDVANNFELGAAANIAPVEIYSMLECYRRN